jgi:hypothetical protein
VLGNKRMGFTRNMHDVASYINFFSLVFVRCGSIDVEVENKVLRLLMVIRHTFEVHMKS